MELFFLYKGKEPLTLYVFKIIQVAAKPLKLELVRYISKGLVVMLLFCGLFCVVVGLHILLLSCGVLEEEGFGETPYICRVMG